MYLTNSFSARIFLRYENRFKLMPYYGLQMIQNYPIFYKLIVEVFDDNTAFWGRCFAANLKRHEPE